MGVSVSFIDVGCGEAIFIYFTDGKTMLIDCGKDSVTADKVIEHVKGFDKDNIDYLVLTHPDVEHIGGAEKIINTFNIGKIYHPNIRKDTRGGEFPLHDKVIELAEEKGIATKISDYYDYIDGKDYAVVFLSPLSSGGAYAEFNGTLSATAQQINNLSPIIYLEIKGVRFILTGDAGKGQEQFVLSQHKVGLYKQWLSNTDIELNFTEVDFLKVSDGGAEEGTSEEFLHLISPRNAVVFAGEGVIPDNVTLKRIQLENEFYNLYRTDVYGSVSVKITGDNEYQIITDKE
ncbi:MAG: MBL fold metallo-hydrolase [Clostridiales bacterium]|nr:MBL fold metallo-hydrolase [Clostridiales bacterium]